MFLLCLGGIIFAIVRWRRHPRVSVMTALSLVVYAIEAVSFSLFLYWFPRLMEPLRLTSAGMNNLYSVVFFLEDFVFAAVIILLVAAALTGRGTETETAPGAPT